MVTASMLHVKRRSSHPRRPNRHVLGTSGATLSKPRNVGSTRASKLHSSVGSTRNVSRETGHRVRTPDVLTHICSACGHVGDSSKHAARLPNDFTLHRGPVDRKLGGGASASGLKRISTPRRNRGCSPPRASHPESEITFATRPVSPQGPL